MTSTLDKLTPHRLTLRFFDLEARIAADSGPFIDLFARMYGRFNAEANKAPVRQTADFTVLTGPDNPWGRPLLSLNGEIRLLHEFDLLEVFLYETVLAEVVAGVRSHFLIHAGVVARKDQGLILAADSSHGKTTLVLELVRRGFDFLSDDIAALGRADRQVHPFPRALRLRPGTLQLTEFAGAADRGLLWLDKLLLDIDQIRPGCAGQATPISHILILQDPAVSPDQVDGPAERQLDVLVDRLNGTFLPAVGRIEGVAAVKVSTDRGLPRLELRVAGRNRIAVLTDVEALCRQHGCLIQDVIKRSESQPVFTNPARLEAITTSQAVVELLRRFQGGHKSALLQGEFGGSTTRLFMELAATIEQAHCYRLYVGPLEEVAELVSGLVR